MHLVVGSSGHERKEEILKTIGGNNYKEILNDKHTENTQVNKFTKVKERVGQRLEKRPERSPELLRTDTIPTSCPECGRKHLC